MDRQNGEQKQNPIEHLAAFIVDKRKAFYLLYIGLAIFCAFSSGWVEVNDDLASYLPAETETRRGLTVMEDEFVTFGTNRVLVDNISYAQAEALAEELEALERVRETLSGYDLYITGDTGDSTSASLDAEMQVVMVVAVVIILLVLLFTSHTYMEIPVLLATFGIGRDLGLILMKAIVLSLLAVFTLMPGLLMSFSHLIDRTHHRSFVPRISTWDRLAVKTRYIMPPIFILLLTGGFIFSNRCPYVYGQTTLTTLR